ncbi:hypothetical protein PTKIN_Ptkin03bG0176100 [Pterospermum kingtungense]
MAAVARSLNSLVLLFLFLSFTDAKDILVGGKQDAWKIPSSESDSLNKWAENSRFRIGDSLVWKYDGGKDSVLQVKKEDYTSCNTSNPIAEYKDGNTKVKLEKSGPYYFISGAKGHCEQGQKLIVVVLSQRGRYTGISPAPSPAEIEAPAIAPTSSAAAFKAGLLVTLGRSPISIAAAVIYIITQLSDDKKLLKDISLATGVAEGTIRNSYKDLHPHASKLVPSCFTDAKDILVGGKQDAWKIPSSESDSLNKWAENSRFRIGDSLVWKYDGGKDSVLQVNKEDYTSCNTSNPIAEYKDGNTKVKLEKSGPYYFISGAKGHCEQGQKLIVVVLSQRGRYTGISPAPSPAEIEAPAIAPTSSAAAFKAGLLVTLGSLVLGFF